MTRLLLEGRRRQLLALLALLVTLAAGRAAPLAPAASSPAGVARPLAITPALRGAIRSSFYAAYRADRQPLRDFSAPAGLPPAALIGPWISEAGLLTGADATENSSWVVAGICIKSAVACQDAGAFQLFERTAAGTAFHWIGYEPCLIPRALAERWYPKGVYPLGSRCSAAQLLVPRGGLRPGSWTALVPASWHERPCASAGPGRLAQELCSSAGGDTDIDVFFDPRDSAERLVVVTCRGGGCSEMSASGAPLLRAPEGTTAAAPPAPWERPFQAAAGVAFAARAGEGPLAIDGLLVASRSGSRPGYPLFTVTTSLPASLAALATVVLASFASPAP